MLLLRFPPARKCLVGTFESFLCGFGEFCPNLHRSDSEGVTWGSEECGFRKKKVEGVLGKKAPRVLFLFSEPAVVRHARVRGQSAAGARTRALWRASDDGYRCGAC